ncbi:uncharacterized protein TNCV_678371 [Trichonephila clavipes]|nr:uncharacterized protein TNCV_678371 [Trichonephila clavipes]
MFKRLAVAKMPILSIPCIRLSPIVKQGVYGFWGFVFSKASLSYYFTTHVCHAGVFIPFLAIKSLQFDRGMSMVFKLRSTEPWGSTRLRTGHYRGMKFDRDGRRSYRNCDNRLDTELIPAHIFDCPAILAALQEREIGVLFSSTNLYVDNIEQIPQTVI